MQYHQQLPNNKSVEEDTQKIFINIPESIKEEISKEKVQAKENKKYYLTFKSYSTHHCVQSILLPKHILGKLISKRRLDKLFNSYTISHGCLDSGNKRDRDN